MTVDDEKPVSPHAHTVDAPTARDDLLGKTLGHYRILDRLGQGGMGVVYRAEDETLRRTVALKVLPDTSGNEERRQRFLREARSAAAITHPNVAVVHTVGEAEGRIFIAMELVEGETLRARLERERFDLPTAKDLAVQIARGLAAAHDKGIVHRDLKPENVMITPSGVVKLLDFGLAKMGATRPASSRTETGLARTEMLVTTDQGRIMGTPEYMSPEQAVGDTLDVRSDVFALGIVFYEMLSGARPFGGASTGGVLVAVARDAAPSLREKLPEVDEVTEAIVARCLAKAPGERFANAGEIVGALAGPTTRSGAEVKHVTGSGMGRLSKNVRLPALGLVLLAAAGVAAWRLAPRRGTSSTPAALASAARPSTSASTDGLPRSPNPDAQRLFEDGMRSFHDGTGQAISLLEQAVKADPTFGGAWIRLWVMGGAGANLWMGTLSTEHVADYREHILALQSTLSSRDIALLDCLEETDFDRANQKLEAYLARNPDDDLAWVARLDTTLATTQRALAANPGLVPLLAYESQQLRESHRFEEAAAAVDQCLEASPRAIDCIAQRAALRDTTGDCAAAESDVRRQLERLPDSPRMHRQLAALLAAQGAPASDVRAAIGGDMTPEPLDPVLPATLVPMFTGDLVEVQRLARDAAEQVAPGGNYYDHLRPAAVLVEAHAEAGDPDGAGRVAADYLSRQVVWKDHERDYAAVMIGAAARAGRLPRAEANRRLDAAFQVAKREGVYLAWVTIYARASETRDEAVLALEKLDALKLPPSPEVDWSSDSLARALFLAGRGTTARPLLEQRVRRCSDALLAPRAQLRAHLYLGELDEQSGDKISACAHYARVLERWGHARPRSVTADEARAHATKLGCAP